MDRQEFKFTNEQREHLLGCWKRKKEKELAVKFLNAAELTISMWRAIAFPNPPISRKEQQQQLDNLALKAKEMIRAFNGLSLQVACALPFIMHLHDESPSNSMPGHFLISPLPGGSSPQGKGAYYMIAESFPDPITQADFCMGFLRKLKAAAEDFDLDCLVEQKPRSKYGETSLLAWLIDDYQEHFKKYPTATNARAGEPGSVSPFRRFAADLGDILKLKL
ncbi:MAG: hypothetical protein FD134_709 [Gallionellaceae bacterium]|nr:MAG: hypothetical protein FD134_709 [Gallionellaceae bacterium]